MKRNVLFGLLCLGVASSLAIAASIPEPIRMLSDAEKEEIIGGCTYDCPDCHEADYDCGGNGNCEDEGDPCEDDAKVDPLNPRCVSGGPHSGCCSQAETYDCYREKTCTCYFTYPGYGCQENEWSEPVPWTKSLKPC